MCEDYVFHIDINDVRRRKIIYSIFLLVLTILIAWCAFNIDGYLLIISYIFYFLIAADLIRSILYKFSSVRDFTVEITGKEIVYKAPKFNTSFLLSELRVKKIVRKKDKVIKIILKHTSGPTVKIEGYTKMNELCELLNSKIQPL